MPLARPERTRVSFGGGEAGAEIELPRKPVVAPALIVAVMFVVSAGVLVFVARGIHFAGVRTIGDLVGVLFHLFWVVGWSLGVAVLGALTVLLWLYRESLYVEAGKLVTVSRLGPLRMQAEYDLARVRNVHVEPQGDAQSVAFDYGEGSRRLGDALSQAFAQKIVAMIAAAAPGAAAAAPQAERPPAAVPVVEPAEEKQQSDESGDESGPLSPGAMAALVAANLVPLAGVLFAGWRLDEVMVLFWAESAVVAFYTLAKMAMVGGWLAIPAGIFFLAHFGAFMAIHFLFIYELFVRGGMGGREPGAAEALAGVFMPLWPALAALFVSHGVSFALNFLGRKEHRGVTVAGLMAAPYKRVMLMQMTLIFGGFFLLGLHQTAPALAILVGLKIAVDLYAHRRERKPHLKLALRAG